MPVKALTLADGLEVVTSRTGSTYALGCIAAFEVNAIAPKGTQLAKATVKRPAGPFVIGCLRAYAEAGLPAVYEWAEYPLIANPDGAAEAKRLAAELYADCYLVFAEFVAAWNRSQMRVA